MTISLSANRRSANEVRMFPAPAGFFEDLQNVLVDLIELHLQGKQAHWNLVGTNFRDLHLQLDSIVDTAREVPNLPPGLLGVTETVETITNRVYAVVGTIRTVHDAVDAVDPSTADVLHGIIDALEKEARLLKSENGTA